LRDEALGVYTRAVKHEQAGELDDALRLYRQAFRMDPRVDRAYHLKEELATRTLETTALPAAPPEQNVEKKAAISVRPGSDDAAGPRVVAHAKRPSSAHHLDRQTSGLLAAIVANFPEPLSFEPEDERALSPLRQLPDELLVHILSYLGVAAIERFARVSRKARVITFDATIWRSVILQGAAPIIPIPEPLCFERRFPRVCEPMDETVLIVHPF
jgi:F-box protein 9